MTAAASHTDYVAGVDFGGTKILVGVFDRSLAPLGSCKKKTKAHRGPAAVMERIARCVRDAVAESGLQLGQLRAIGLGAPGPVDPTSGHVLFAGNLGWENVPLKTEMERQLGVPVFVENDANNCVLGIHEWELKGRPSHLVGIFIGTGIGAGLILNGRLFSGLNRTAGEIGHMVLDVHGPICSCGNHGCFEALASRTAIFRAIKSAVKAGQKTVLTQMLGPKLEDLRSGDIRKALLQGDLPVRHIIDEAARFTGIAVANVINLLNPEVIMLGGGVIEALEDEMMSTIIDTAHAYAMPHTAKGIHISATRLGDDAGIVGAAVLALQNVGLPRLDVNATV